MQIAIVLFEHFTALDARRALRSAQPDPGGDGAHDRGREGDDPHQHRDARVAGGHHLRGDPRARRAAGPRRPRAARHREGSELREWLLEADRHSTWTTSVCTGSFVLASAGLLAGRRATSHWLARAELAAYGVEPSDDRVVVDGKYVTAAGVSAGMDMALTLVARAFGDELAQAIQLGIEYDPQPPFDSGGPTGHRSGRSSSRSARSSFV